MPKRTPFFILLFLSSLILLSFFSGCLPVTPEPEPVTTGTIYGYVAIPDNTKDLTGYSPIPGATVTIVDAEGVTHTVLTDENGYYCFTDINVKVNTIINITKDTGDGGKLIFKDVVSLAVSPEEDYDAGIADVKSTATALIVEGLIQAGWTQEEIDLEEIAAHILFDDLEDYIQQAQNNNQDLTGAAITTTIYKIINNIVNPPSPALSSAKEMTSYKFEAATNAVLTSDVIGTVDSGAHTIALTVPYGTDTTALVATFELSTSASAKAGSTTQASGTTANDFTSPVTYTVTAEDGSTQDFIVTVTVAIGPLNHFTITGYPASTTAGENFGSNNIIITAYDGNNKIKTDYTGQVYFTSTDGSAIVPYTLGSKYIFTTGDNGTHTFPGTGFTLKTAGSKTITLTEGIVFIASSSITVNPADANYFKVTGTASMTAGGSNTITITAYDQYDNIATGYDGDKTLTFSGASSSSDPVTSPTCSNKDSADIDFASDTVITFTDGVGTSTMKLYKAEIAHIKATQGSIETSDSNDLDVDVTDDSLSYVKIEDTAGGAGSEVGTHSMTADETFTVYAAGYDTYGNYKNDESVNWTGSDVCSGKLSPTSGISTTFTPTAAGDGTITADHSTVTDDTTGTITVWDLTVTYNGNGNTGGSVPTDSTTYKENDTVTVLGNTGSLVKTGWTFIGWNTQADGNGTPRSVDSTFNMGTSNVTLYAKWTPLYALRDTGPAGGLIFYVKGGGYSEGWMYLEAAPLSGEGLSAWSNITDTSVGTTGIAIGDGQTNTTLIVNQSDCTSGAALYCENLVEGGYNDWFLPSKDELNLMYTNLKVSGVGGFASYYYWNSSEAGTHTAWIQNFDNGSLALSYKVSAFRVRAVRAF